MNIIYYHADCPDGWCAAYIAKKKYPEAELVALKHGLSDVQLEQLFELSKDQDVIMVDYSLRTRELNDRLNEVARSFHIFDHHKTAQAILKDAKYATFDMTRSGAGLAWDYLFGKDSSTDSPDMPLLHKNRPWFVDFVEDRDLYNWKLPKSKEVCAYLNTLPLSFEAWDALDWSVSADGGCAMRICSIQGCGKNHYAKTFCKTHYTISYEKIYKLKRQTEEGKQKEKAKNLKYGQSFNGNMTRRFKGKGLSEEEKNKAKIAFLNFNGRCYCCNTSDKGKKGWVLDHKSEKFRGILCVQCNLAAGLLKDNIKRCKNLISYLNKNNKMGPDRAAELGASVLSYIEYYTRSVVAEVQEGILYFQGHSYLVGVLNMPYLGVSEAGNALVKTKGFDIGLAWFESGDGMTQFFLRSDKDGLNLDVSAIAKQYGGGGHQNAAGFKVTIDEGRAIVDQILIRKTPVWEVHLS
jgi:oligoribonuclease NrnB/cAMP/cGMP phosphodiesterase (DHH superfamily)